MLERIDRCWRVAGTGLSFFVFGAGGLLLRVFAFPAINVFVRDRKRRIAIARNVIRFTFRAFVELMHGLGVLRYEVSGVQKLNREGLLIIANHPTLIDTVLLMAFVKHADCIVKNGLWNNPFTHGPVRAAGYINNEDGPELIDKCVASLRSGSNLIVFPEGTRTPREGTIHFRRGAANIAVRGRCNVTPVLIRCTPLTLGKGDKWWKVPARRVRLSIEVREEIEVHSFVAEAQNETLAARHLNQHLQNYFAEESRRHAAAA